MGTVSLPAEASPRTASDNLKDTENSPLRGEPRRLSQQKVELLGLALGVAILVAATLARRLTTDVFWSLTAGLWILNHHALFGADAFTYTEPHRRWIADEWGSEVALASMYKAFGEAAYNYYAIATGTLSLLCTMAYSRALGARGGRVAAMMVLLAIGLAPVITQDRGESFSLIWLPLELLILTKARENPRWLLWVPPLFLCWVNTHGSILLGLLILGIEFAWSCVPPQRVTSIGGLGRSPYSGYLALAGAAGIVTSSVSPYGPALLLYDLHVSTSSQIGQAISEWMSPDFHSLEDLAFYCVPLLIMALTLRSRRFMVLEGTVATILFLAALHSERFIVYVFVVCCGLAACLPARAQWSARARRSVGALGLGIAIAVLARPSVPAGSVTADTPVQAFNFLSAHPGRVFTEYNWGDYSIMRNRATFMDGRTDYFSGAVFAEYFAVSGLSVDPDPVLSRYHVSYVIWAPNTPLANFLSHDSRWRVVDRTGPAFVFARHSAS